MPRSRDADADFRPLCRLIPLYLHFSFLSSEHEYFPTPHAVTFPEMRLEPISKTSKDILDAMRSLINKGETNHLKENASGWQYGGEEFNKVVESLRQQMQQELKVQGFHVIALLFLFSNKMLIGLAGGWLYRSTFPQRRKHIELSLPGKTNFDDPN